jgi:SAM-dependent methyltransferase
MSARARLRPSYLSLETNAAANAAAAYNQVTDDYSAYADGHSTSLYSFDGLYAYGDRLVWRLLDKRLTERRSSGARSISILDAGCGPGTWLRRSVARAHALGFNNIIARGFDIAEAQIVRAKALSRDLSALPGVDLTFEVGDLLGRLPEADATVDLCLCLYGVLNHLPVASLTAIFAELARITAGRFVSTVRSAGSTPTIFVDSLEKARDFKQDNSRDRCEVELHDGRQIAFGCHLFTATELRQLVAQHFDVEDCRGLDLFHNRFALDPRWNPPALSANRQLPEELTRLEETYSVDPNFMDRAAHLLLVARGRQT